MAVHIRTEKKPREYLDTSLNIQFEHLLVYLILCYDENFKKTNHIILERKTTNQTIFAMNKFICRNVINASRILTNSQMATLDNKITKCVR